MGYDQSRQPKRWAAPAVMVAGLVAVYLAADTARYATGSVEVVVEDRSADQARADHWDDDQSLLTDG